MAFNPRGRFGPPYIDSRNHGMRYGIPTVPWQGIMGPRGRGENHGSFERFPPPPTRDFPGRFRGGRWQRPENEQYMGGPRGRSFATRNYVPRHRFDNFKRVKQEPLDIPTGTESELIGKPISEKSIKLEDTAELNDRKNVPSRDNISQHIKQEEGTLEIKLDEYNSDLHFNSDESGLIGWTLHKDGFECLWGGGRATHGVKRGKVAFEVTVLEALPVQVPETERNPHVLRVGWSVDGADLQLGEDHLSYGYGGTGKISVNSKFTDYGHPFHVGDVLTCCLDLDAKPKNIFYLLNGNYLGIAFSIGNELGGKALYPHVTVKNMKFQANFGGQWPKHPITPGFAMLQNAPHQDLMQAQEGPGSRQDAEVIMMVGLPSCGKTFWAEKYCKDNPGKRYYMLGTNNIIEKMRIFGLTRKRNYHGRWDALIKQATGCLNTWLKIAEKRVHNYIIDQTNVYFTARRRKMNNFRGYKRTAVVVLNEPPVLADRSEKVQREEGKIIPVNAVMEMKANFSLPEAGESFDEVMYVEVKPPRAFELVKVLVNEGQAFKRGEGLPNERDEPRTKFPRLNSHAVQGESMYSTGTPKGGKDYFDRERKPSLSSETNLGVQKGSYKGTKDPTGPSRAVQERTLGSWDGWQTGNSGSYRERMPVPNKHVGYNEEVKHELLDMQGYRGYGTDMTHGNWAPASSQMDRREEAQSYPRGHIYEHGPTYSHPKSSRRNTLSSDQGQQGFYSPEKNLPTYTCQSNVNYSFNSKPISDGRQADICSWNDGSHLVQNNRLQNTVDNTGQFASSNINEYNIYKLAGPDQQRGCAVMEGNVSRDQQQQTFMRKSQAESQGYCVNTYSLQQGYSHQQSAPDTGVQGYDMTWTKAHTNAQAAYTSRDNATNQQQQQHQHWQPKSSYF